MLKFLAKGEISKGNCEGKMRWGLKTVYFKMMSLSKVLIFRQGTGSLRQQIPLFLWRQVLASCCYFTLAPRQGVGNGCQGESCFMWERGSFLRYDVEFMEIVVVMVLWQLFSYLVPVISWRKREGVLSLETRCSHATCMRLQSLWLLSWAQIFCLSETDFSKLYCLKFCFLLVWPILNYVGISFFVF